MALTREETQAFMAHLGKIKIKNCPVCGGGIFSIPEKVFFPMDETFIGNRKHRIAITWFCVICGNILFFAPEVIQNYVPESFKE